MLKKYDRVSFSCLEKEHYSWWRPWRAFQLFKKYVFLSREIASPLPPSPFVTDGNKTVSLKWAADGKPRPSVGLAPATRST